MTGRKENPFRYLRRKSNGELFGEDIVESWYIAREYVLAKLSDVGFRVDSEEHLHVIVDGDNPQMLFVARQVALSAHYLNFKEKEDDVSCRNRTVITIVSNNPDIEEELQKEEYLCNLPKYCKFVNSRKEVKNEDSYIDMEIHVVERSPGEDTPNTIKFSVTETSLYFSERKRLADLGIDTRMAVYTSEMYDLGNEIMNLPSEDINCAQRYALALNVYQREKLRKVADKMVIPEKWETMELWKVKEAISNIYCSDCFRIREASMNIIRKKDEKNAYDVWEMNIEWLTKSEHARWNVEKLIMGYRPFNDHERYIDECLHVKYNSESKIKKYRNSLKRRNDDPAHIDLRSYADLRRIDPDNMKYDTFLMLAIPRILEQFRE